MAVLFSPLLAVGAFSIYTLVRVVPQVRLSTLSPQPLNPQSLDSKTLTLGPQL